MLKKLLIAIFIVFFALGSYAQADDFKEVTLIVDTPYILVLDADAESFSVTNPNILNIKTLDTIDNSKDQIIITGVVAGITKLGITTAEKSYKYVVKVISSGNTNSGDFMELDIPEGGNN